MQLFCKLPFTNPLYLFKQTKLFLTPHVITLWNWNHKKVSNLENDHYCTAYFNILCKKECELLPSILYFELILNQNVLMFNFIYSKLLKYL